MCTRATLARLWKRNMKTTQLQKQVAYIIAPGHAPEAKALYEDALLRTAKQASRNPDKNFCHYQYFHGRRLERGLQGLKPMLMDIIESNAWAAAHQDLMYQTLLM